MHINTNINKIPLKKLKAATIINGHNQCYWNADNWMLFFFILLFIYFLHFFLQMMCAFWSNPITQSYNQCLTTCYLFSVTCHVFYCIKATTWHPEHSRFIHASTKVIIHFLFQVLFEFSHWRSGQSKKVCTDNNAFSIQRPTISTLTYKYIQEFLSNKVTFKSIYFSLLWGANTIYTALTACVPSLGREKLDVLY